MPWSRTMAKENAPGEDARGKKRPKENSSAARAAATGSSLKSGRDGKKQNPKYTKKYAKKYAQKYRRPRGGEARSISDLMPEIGRAAFRRYGFIQSSVVSRWPEIVGERYANVSLPESIRFPRGEKEGGTLHLLVSGAHATLMQHIAPEIIERVNRFFGYGAVSQVRFRQGAVNAEKTKEKRPALPASLKPAPIELGESLRDIGDPELNRVLESLASGVANAQEAGRQAGNQGRNEQEGSESGPMIGMEHGIKIVGTIGGNEKPARKDEKDQK